MANFFTDTPEQYKQFPNLSPKQIGIQEQLGSSGLDLLRQIQGGKFDFAPIENQARQNFNTQTIPGLAERFTALGGGQNSSAFQGALGQAATGLESNLASLKSQHGLNQQNMQQDLLGKLLSLNQQPSYNNLYIPQQQGFGKSAGLSILQLLPILLALSGGGGGLLGAGAGALGGLSSWLGGK